MLSKFARTALIRPMLKIIKSKTAIFEEQLRTSYSTFVSLSCIYILHAYLALMEQLGLVLKEFFQHSYEKLDLKVSFSRKLCQKILS